MKLQSQSFAMFLMHPLNVKRGLVTLKLPNGALCFCFSSFYNYWCCCCCCSWYYYCIVYTMTCTQTFTSTISTSTSTFTFQYHRVSYLDNKQNLEHCINIILIICVPMHSTNYTRIVTFSLRTAYTHTHELYHHWIVMPLRLIKLFGLIIVVCFTMGN